MTRMTTKRQVILRDMLREKKRAMWNDVRTELFRQTGEELHGQFDLPLDPAERGLIDLLEDTGLQVASIRMQELTALDEAMGRLEQGTYGICDACGEEIPEERLQVMPFARYCIADQEKREGPSHPPGVTM